MPGESCAECSYLVGHAKWCGSTPDDPKTVGWNEAIEAAALMAEQNWEDATSKAEAIRALKK